MESKFSPSQFLFLYSFLNFLISIFIFRDVRKRLLNELLPAIIWSLSVFIGGPFVLLVYFLFRPSIAPLEEYVFLNCGKQIIKMPQTSLSPKRSFFSLFGEAMLALY